MERIKTIKRLFIDCSLLVLLFSNLAFADYIGPSIVVKGDWGTGNNKFGIKYQDTFDSFPTRFEVNRQGNIFLSDERNKCVKVFDQNGNLISIIKPINVEKTKYLWPKYINCDSKNNIYALHYTKLQKYRYNGALIWEVYVRGKAITVLPDDSVIILGFLGGFKEKKKYIQYSHDGKLLKADIDRPLALGNYGRERDVMWEDTIKVQFPEKTFEIPNSEFLRDHIGNVYVIERKTNHPKSSDLYMGYVYSDLYYKILRYDFCSTLLLSEYDFPKNEMKIDSKDNTVGYRSEVVFEYGQPVISPNGDIYCWKRTPDTYSILKWTWVESPDSPLNLRATASKEAVSLTWELPQEDSANITGYEILSSTDPCGQFNEVGKTKKSVLTYIDKDIKAGETYYYRVRAVKKDGYSGYSNKAVGEL